MPAEEPCYKGDIQAMFTLASIAGPLIGEFIIDHLRQPGL